MLTYNDRNCPDRDPEEGCIDCPWQWECSELGNPNNPADYSGDDDYELT